MTKKPMTKTEAVEIIATMKRETPVNAQKRLIEMAIGGFGNLSDDAKAVYSARLFEMGETK